MKLNDHILLWNHVFIKVLDVRHTVMEKGDEVQSYQLPASTFLFTVRGSARVRLDNNLHLAQRFHLFHGGKGMNLNILAEDELEYYMILYKAILSLPCRQEIVQLIEEENPFQYQYAFAPSYPLILFETIERLDRDWRSSTALGKLQVKALFYQFVYELLRQLHHQEIEPIKPDRAALAARYIRENFQEPLTLDSIAQTLECSSAHLSRLFKSRMKTSPIHYLGQVRADRTMELLMRTDANLQEIAERVGFPDAHSLSRSFKKYTGISPSRFRKKQLRNSSWQDRHRELPLSMQRNALLQNNSDLYTDIENHFQYQMGRELFMQKRTRIAAIAMLMCLSLLVAACSSPAGTNGNSQALANNVETQANSGNSNGGQETMAQAKTRIISTLKGDVEVPAEPQRVASDQYMGQLLKLGIIPVGVRDGMLDEAWIEKAGISEDILANIESLGEFPMNPEKLILLEPDLIIGSIEDNIEQYEKIGTTVFLPYWEGESTAGPIEKFRRISEIFGKQQEAEQWITEYEQKVEEARKQIDGIIKDGETVSIVQVGSKAIFVLAAKGGNYGSGTIYEMLQLPPTEKAAQMTNGFENVSLEVLPEYLGDHVFVYVNSKEDAEEVLNSTVWKGSPAVKKGQVYMYGEFDDEFVMEDPYSLELQLETIVNILLENR